MDISHDKKNFYSITYIWNQYTDLENRLEVVKGEGQGVGWTGSLGLICKLLHLEWISNEILLYSIGQFI